MWREVVTAVNELTYKRLFLQLCVFLCICACACLCNRCRLHYHDKETARSDGTLLSLQGLREFQYFGSKKFEFLNSFSFIFLRKFKLDIAQVAL